MAGSTGGEWWKHDEQDVSSRGRSSAGSGSAEQRRAERGSAGRASSGRDERSSSRYGERGSSAARDVRASRDARTSRDGRAGRGASLSSRLDRPERAARPSDTASYTRSDLDGRAGYGADARVARDAYAGHEHTDYDSYLARDEREGAGRGSYASERTSVLYGNDRPQDPRTVGREAPTYAGQADAMASYGPSTYTEAEYASRGYSASYARRRQREEGYRIDPSAGEAQASRLPNSRHRSVGSVGSRETVGAHHEGPANAADYGASRFPHGPATIPDDRDPRARQRRRKQRPLGWGANNVPQMNRTNNVLGGFGYKPLNGNQNTWQAKLKKAAPILGVVLAVVLVVLILRGIVGCATGLVAGSATEPETAATTEAATTDAAQTASYDTSVATKVLDEGRKTASGIGTMSFSAVGDNLMNDNLLTLADSWAGSEGDGEYDFSPFYTEVSDYIQKNCDVSFINQETTLGGTDSYGYAGYPSYNTPDSMADAVANAGWRIVNTNSNHTYDYWTSCIEHAQEVWNAKSSLLTVGSYTSEDDRNTIRVVECNGIRLATLSYSYGQNGYEQSDLPNDYYAVPYDEEKLKTEVANARKVADVVMVYLHFGTEYTNEANSEQEAIAQVCADNGVDLVIGSHAHVIQPVKWIERASGGKMLCAYGLGDFVAGYTGNPDTIMSGMLTCNFVRVSGDDANADNVGPGGIAVEDVVWHPLVEHMEGNTDTVRFVKSYTADEANANELLATLDDPRGWLVSQTQAVIGDEVTIDV